MINTRLLFLSKRSLIYTRIEKSKGKSKKMKKNDLKKSKKPLSWSTLLSLNWWTAISWTWRINSSWKRLCLNRLWSVLHTPFSKKSWIISLCDSWLQPLSRKRYQMETSSNFKNWLTYCLSVIKTFLCLLGKARCRFNSFRQEFTVAGDTRIIKF